MAFVYKKYEKYILRAVCSVKLLHGTENLVIFSLIIERISLLADLWFKLGKDSLIEVC